MLCGKVVCFSLGYLAKLVTMGLTHFIKSPPKFHQRFFGQVSPHTRVSRQVEDQSGEKREQHAGNDDVDNEVERKPQHQEMISDVEVWCVGTAGVEHPVFPAPVVL